MDDFKRELVEQHPALDLEVDPLLYEWLSEKHKKTLRKQGVQAVAEIARRDIKEYFDLKDTFLRELSGYSLDMDDAADHRLALELWNDRGYSIVVDGQDVYRVAKDVESEVSRYVLVKESYPPVVGTEALVSRFHERNLEAPVKLDQKQRDFVSAYSEFISKAIQLDYRILKLRRNVLGDSERTVSHEEATNLVRSPAVQRLPLDFFIETGTPVVGHTAKHVPVEGAPYNLYVEPSARFVNTSEIRMRPMSFRWIATNGVLEKHPVADSSLLAELQELCIHLAKHHPITEEMVAYLVLCGGTVQVASLAGRVSDTQNAQVGAYAYDHSTITLTVPSWVRPEQVQQAYAKLRAQALAKNRYRSRSDRNIAIFRFVMERAEPLPPKDLVPGTRGTFKFPPWRTLVKEWNKPLPKDHRWRFDQFGYTAEKRFRNAFADGYEAITGKKYYRPKRLTTKEEVEEATEAVKGRLLKTLRAYAEKHDNRWSEEE
jgi:hypothetical protein